MTTKLRKPVFRETQAAVRDRGAKFRPLVVGIIPGDVIVLRLKGTRYGCEIAISSVWHEAMTRKAVAEAQAKRAARKGRATR